MKTLTTTELVTVAGGSRASDALTAQVTALQGSIKDVASASQNNNGGNNNTMMTMAMMMAMRPQAPSVVAAAPAAAPVVNISTRVGRRW